jgi:hypothetical protein
MAPTPSPRLMVDSCASAMRVPETNNPAASASPSRRPKRLEVVRKTRIRDLPQSRLNIDKSRPDDQRGFTQILRGIVPAFRNKTHHHIADTFSREDAMPVCGFIDVLLRIADDCTKVK